MTTHWANATDLGYSTPSAGNSMGNRIQKQRSNMSQYGHNGRIYVLKFTALGGRYYANFKSEDFVV